MLSPAIRRALQKAREDLVFFATRILGIKPTWQQLALFKRIMRDRQRPLTGHPKRRRKKQAAIAAGQGVGKTTSTVAIALWLLIQHEGTLGIVTAPTLRQVQGVWFTELRRVLGRAVWWFRECCQLNAAELVFGGNRTWCIKGVTAVKPEKLQGWHEKHMFFILDEASGIERPLVNVVKGTLTNADCYLIAIGNPNRTDTAFYEFFHGAESKRWIRMRFNAEESPLVPKERILAAREEWGYNHDEYRIRVLGLFPQQNQNTILPLAYVNSATESNREACRVWNGMDPHCAIGIDFARFGGDESAIYVREGGAIIYYKVFAGMEPKDVVLHAMGKQRELGWSNDECIYVADANGMGESVMYMFYEQGKQLFEFKAQKRSPSVEYDKLGTASWFLFRKLLATGNIWIPNDPRLLEQLKARQYTYDSGGFRKIESKIDYKKRTEMPSPDRADALVLCYYSQAIASMYLANPTRNMPKSDFKAPQRVPAMDVLREQSKQAPWVIESDEASLL